MLQFYALQKCVEILKKYYFMLHTGTTNDHLQKTKQTQIKGCFNTYTNTN